MQDPLVGDSYVSAEPREEKPIKLQKLFNQKLGSAVAMIFLMSVIEMVAAAVPWKDCVDDDVKEKTCAKKYVYATLVGAISILVTGTWLALSKFIGAGLIPWLSTFLAIWWTVGAGVLTFHKPFLTTENGYFASWLCCIASVYLFVNFAVPTSHSALAKSPVVGLLLSSVVTLTSGTVSCDYGSCDRDKAFAIACGAVSVAFCLLLIQVARLEGSTSSPLGNALILWVKYILFGMWFAAIFVLTFGEAVFNVTGNGYFGTWTSLVLSGVVCWQGYLDPTI